MKLLNVLFQCVQFLAASCESGLQSKRSGLRNLSIVEDLKLNKLLCNIGD